MGSETVKCACGPWQCDRHTQGTVVLKPEADPRCGATWLTLRTSRPVGYCADCGARFTLLASGDVEVGPSQDQLLVALALELSDHGDCPMDYSDWKCPATPETHDCESGPVELCWLIYYGLATTYAEAQALWKRMEEASKCE